jgi:hypothetical protein
MPERQFANQKALLGYAERNALVYAGNARPRLPSGNGC